MNETLLPRLIDLILRLRADTASYQDTPDAPQCWYDRGYADGMLAAMHELGHGAALPQDLAGDLDTGAAAAERLTPWGRAYAHGMEMGRKETFEVLEAD
jgi:hypothetical protein